MKQIQSWFSWKRSFKRKDVIPLFFYLFLSIILLIIRPIPELMKFKFTWLISNSLENESLNEKIIFYFRLMVTRISTNSLLYDFLLSLIIITRYMLHRVRCKTLKYNLSNFILMNYD